MAAAVASVARGGGGGGKPEKGSPINVTLLVIHGNIVVYALAYWLVSPVMPYILKEHGASSLEFGMYQSLFGIVQLAGGLFVGDLQDRYSGSTALSLTQLGSAAVYGILFQATSLNMLYLSRIPVVLQQCMQVAQACISKATSNGDERALSLGRLSLSYGLGMIIGSTLSGRIAEAFGNHIPAIVAFCLSLAMCVVNKFMLNDLGSIKKDADVEKIKPTAKQQQSTEGKDGGETNKYLGLTGYFRLLAKLSDVVIFLVLMFAAKSLYEPVYSLTLMSTYKITQSQMGMLMSGFGVLGMASNVFLLPLVLKFSSETQATMVSLLGGAVCYSLLTIFASQLDVTGYLAIFAVLSVFSSLLYTLSTSYISRAVEKAAHGQAIALSHSLRSAVGIGCPLVGTYLLERHGAFSVSGVGSIMLFAACISVVTSTKKKNTAVTS